MVRRLLFFSILRTRSARKKLVGWSVIVLLGVFVDTGCEDDAPSRLTDLAAQSAKDPTSARPAPPDQPPGTREELARRIARELEALEIEAGIDRGHDPPAPGGDLAHDIEAFTTLDACVRAHRVTDPVLADAVDSLGYDTLVRDACRILQALKAKDGKLCLPIAASPLRQRCEVQVAILAGEPARCPLAVGGSPVQGREPICLARASRDERLCAAALPADRAVCKAMVSGRSNECGSDEACIRQVERYRTLLEKPPNLAPFASRLRVEFVSDRAKSETYQGGFDLDDVAAAGAIARGAGDKVRLVIGPPKNGLWPSWDSPHATPLLSLVLSLPTKMPTASAKGDGAPGWVLGPSDLSLDLLIPHIAQLSGTLASDRRVVFENVSAVSGSPIRFTLTTNVSDAGRTFHVKIDGETFVRDGLDARPGAKLR
jgi:hypothetical protein